MKPINFFSFKLIFILIFVSLFVLSACSNNQEIQTTTPIFDNEEKTIIPSNVDNQINSQENNNNIVNPEENKTLTIHKEGLIPRNLNLTFNRTTNLMIINKDIYSQEIEIPIYGSEFQGKLIPNSNISITIIPKSKGFTTIKLNKQNVGTINVN
jgi:hypothetical protein